MPSRWLLKSEPGDYSYDDLVVEKKTRWDGVANPVAQRNLRAMKKGDLAAFYHTGSQRRVVGIVEIAADPADDFDGMASVHIKPRIAVASPVTLETLKADPGFKDSPLVKQGRLSVVELTEAQWKALLKLSGTDL
jgi:predicted RNA-binding protein with PUA-like domain